MSAVIAPLKEFSAYILASVGTVLLPVRESSSLPVYIPGSDGSSLFVNYQSPFS